MNRRTFLSGLAAFVIAFPLALSAGPRSACAEGDDIAVVVHRGNPINLMNRAQLSGLFKAKMTEFPGGGHADPVNLAPDNPVRQSFDLAVLGMTPDEVERYWLDSKIRSGVGSPRRLSGPEAVLRFVSNNDAGIGYVASADANASVKVVARIRGGVVVAP